jgi:hypothetical protein
MNEILVETENCIERIYFLFQPLSMLGKFHFMGKTCSILLLDIQNFLLFPQLFSAVVFIGGGNIVYKEVYSAQFAFLLNAVTITISV